MTTAVGTVVELVARLLKAKQSDEHPGSYDGRIRNRRSKRSHHVIEDYTMNRDELEGKAEALKGRLKQAAGHLTDNPDLHDEGVADETAGNTQDAIGHARRKVGEVIENIGNTIKK